MGQGSAVKTLNLSLDCESVRWAPEWRAAMLFSSMCMLLECFLGNNSDKPGMCLREQARKRSAGELGEEGLLCEGRVLALWTQGAAQAWEESPQYSPGWCVLQVSRDGPGWGVSRSEYSLGCKVWPYMFIYLEVVWRCRCYRADQN